MFEICFLQNQKQKARSISSHTSTPGSLWLKNAIDAKAANALTLISAWYSVVILAVYQLDLASFWIRQWKICRLAASRFFSRFSFDLAGLSKYVAGFIKISKISSHFY